MQEKQQLLSLAKETLDTIIMTNDNILTMMVTKDSTDIDFEESVRDYEKLQTEILEKIFLLLKIVNGKEDASEKKIFNLMSKSCELYVNALDFLLKHDPSLKNSSQYKPELPDNDTSFWDIFKKWEG